MNDESTVPLAPANVVIETPLNRAVQRNDQKLFIQNILNSSMMKITATGFLLASLFAASFLVAYQEVERTRASESLYEVPKAEIIMPNQRAAPTSIPTEAKMCGGIGALQCDMGYICKIDETFPDASGTCIKE